MHVGVIGGTGFIGRHLVDRLRGDCHVTVGSRRMRHIPDRWTRDPTIEVVKGDVTDLSSIAVLAEEVDVIANLAGINVERGTQTFHRVHVEGMQRVIDMALTHGVDRILLTSYLRARPGTDSPYLESKWLAEEQARNAAIPATVLKPAGVFGPDDQLLSNLSRWLLTFPVLPIPAGSEPIRPVAVQDVVRVCEACLLDRATGSRTIPLMGPERLSLQTLAERVARSIGTRCMTMRMPYRIVSLGAWAQEGFLDEPIISRASARMLHEGMVEPAPAALVDTLPEGSEPSLAPTTDYIRRHLEPPGPITPRDFRIVP